MGKRSNFEPRPQWFYPTPYEAVVPLLPHLDNRTYFDEPCCGDGSLILHLVKHGHNCTWASDIYPRGWGTQDDALVHSRCRGDCIITNPPWERSVLHPMIEHFSGLAPTWLLIDADWMHTKQSAPYIKGCRKIVSVGRVRWIPNTKMTGKDNVAWYLFDRSGGPTEFVGR